MRKHAPVEVAAAAKGDVASAAVAITMKGATASIAITITANRVAVTASATTQSLKAATLANEMKDKRKTTQTIAASPHHQCKGTHQVIITTTLKTMQRCQIGEVVVQRRN